MKSLLSNLRLVPLFLVACLASVQAATIVVNSATDPSGFNPNITIPTLGATVTLRDAVNAANNTAGDDTITFAPALAGQTILLSNVGDGTFGPSGLAVSSVVTIDGGTAGVTIARDAAAQPERLRLFYITSDGNLTLENLTVRDGLAAGGSSYVGGGAAGLGGAIVNAGTLQLVQTTLTNNQAVGGAGTDPQIPCCQGGGLGQDSQPNGGGGPNGGNSSALNGGFGGGGASDSSHNGNPGHGGNGGFGGGGGLGVNSSTVDGTGGNGGFGAGGGGSSGTNFQDGHFPGAGGFGGGIGYSLQHFGGGGGAGLGGAIFNYGGTVLITNSTLAGNSALGAGTDANYGGATGHTGSGLGGAIFNLNGNITTVSATLVGNIANQGGGAIYNLGDNGVATQSGPMLPSTSAPLPAQVTLTNTILSGSKDSANNPVSDYVQNTNNSGSGTGAGFVASSGTNNIVQVNSDSVSAFTGINTLTADPQLGSLANGGGPTQTVELLTGSPAIDAAIVYGGITNDQRGISRPQRNTADIGAFEARPAQNTAITLTNSNVSVAANGQAFDLANAVGPTPAGGIFSGPGVSNNQFDPASVPEGVYTITYTLPSAEFPGSTTFSVAVTEPASLVVTLATDTASNTDDQTSLREAVAYANSLGSPQTITFAPSLAGQTIILNTGWNDASDTSALRISGQVTIQGPTTAPGVAIAITNGVQKRHILVENSGVLTLSNLTFTNGYASDYGGSVWSLGSLTVRSCTFNGNYAAQEGGAIQSGSGSSQLLIENSTFSDNTSDGAASAIDGGATSMNFRYLTITNNTATNGTGNAVVINQNEATMVNTIIAENNNDGVGSINGGAFSAQSSNNLLGPGETAGLTNGVNGNLVGVSAPMLLPLADNGGPTRTVALLPGSPALNAGAAVAGIATDQRGISRSLQTNGGLRGRYYALSSDATTDLLSPISNLESLMPNVTLLTPRIDFGAGTEDNPGDGSVIDREASDGNFFGGLGIDIGTQNIAALWDGFINVPEDADYDFTTRSDDGSVLYIDGTLIVDNNNLQGMTNVNSTVFLTAGLHAIECGYFQAGGGGGMQVYWSNLDGNNPFDSQVIPPGVLFTDAGVGSAPDIGAFEARITVPTFTTTTINLPAGSDPINLFTATGVNATNGVFSGPGVTNGVFDPAAVGPGIYILTYTITSPDGTVTVNITVTVTETPSLVVNRADDMTDNFDSQTSLREAIVYAQSLGGTQTVTFDPSLAGQTVTLSTGWNDANDSSALQVSGHVTIQGLVAAPGITITMAQGVQKRHFYVENSGNLTLSHLTFTNGYAADNGGSISNLGSLRVTNCTFTGNVSTAEGGAIQSSVSSTLLAIDNSTFAGNTSNGSGSSISTGASANTFRYLTITSNTSQTNQGTLTIHDTAVTMVDSILAGNNNDGVLLSGSGAFSNQSTNNLLGSGGSGGLVNGTNGNLVGVTDPVLAALVDNGGPTKTIALLNGSPALDAGVAVTDIATDQRGISRALLSGGLRGRYYAVPFDTSPDLLSPISNLEALTANVTLTTPRVDFGFGTENSPGDGSVLDREASDYNIFGGIGVDVGLQNTAALWDGFISVPETATYVFTTRSDDGSVLYIDGTLVVDNNNLQGMTNVSGQVQLTAGLHSILIGYFQNGGGSGMQASWEQIDGATPFARQIIPPEVLFSGDNTGSAPDIGAFEARLGVPPALTIAHIDVTAGDAPIDLAAATQPFPAGGVFSGPGVTGGQFDPTGLAPGDYTLTYTVTGPDGVSTSITFTITIVQGETASLVVTTADDTVDNFDNKTSLREAIAYAGTLSGTSTITFSNSSANGTTNFYDGDSHTLNLNGSELVVNSHLTIQGPGASVLTVSANQNSRVLTINASATVHLDALTIADGKISGGPDQSNLGAGIKNSGMLTVTNCAVFRNGIDDGATQYDFGGGIYNDGTLVVANSLFDFNYTYGVISKGAGIYNTTAGTVTLTNSTFFQNGASTFQYASGGGMDNEGTATVVNCTFASNGASNDGGGVFNGGVLNIGNTLVAQNGSSDITGEVASQGHNLIGNTNGVSGLINTDLQNADPQLDYLNNNGGPTQTVALLPGSPAINAGGNDLAVDPTTQLPLTTDQRGNGFPRVAIEHVDIGAFEVFSDPTFVHDSIRVASTDSPIDLGLATGAFPPGGAFSGQGVTNGMFDPAGLAIGSYTVTYTIAASTGETKSADATVVVARFPNLFVTTLDDMGSSNGEQNSLRDVLNFASAQTGPQTITFSSTEPGAAVNFYDGNSHTIVLDGEQLTIGSDVIINGPGASVLIISANHLSRALTIAEDATAQIDGLTFADGEISDLGSHINGQSDDSYGAGIDNEGTLTLTNCAILNNKITALGAEGGGLYNNGTATLDHCTISGNSANFEDNGYSEGGGIANEDTLALTNCIISSNAVTGGDNAYNLGGGIYNDGNLTFANTIVSNNTLTGGDGSTNRGGGIFTYDDLTIPNSTISDNTITAGNSSDNRGGGMYCNDPVMIVASTVSGNGISGGTGSYNIGGGIWNGYRLTLTNATVFGNMIDGSGTNSGGAIYNDYELTLTNATFSGNSISGGTSSGGAIYNGYTATLTDTIVAGDNSTGTAPDIFGAVNSQGYNLIGNTADSSGWTGSDILNEDPMLDMLHDNGGATLTMALLPGSPAIDAAITIANVTTDQRGISRPQGSAPDIGAFEAEAVSHPATITSANNTTFVVGTNDSFQLTASGYPATFTFTNVGVALPGGVTLSTDGLLSGVPAAGTGGIYNLTFQVSNGIEPNGTQNFTLTINEPAAITSSGSATFAVGTSGSFQLTASGYPATYSFSNVGAALPGGVTLSSNGLLSGIPGADTGGVYSLTFQVSNGTGSDGMQSFTLTVIQPATFTSTNATSFAVGSNGNYQLTASGYPATYTFTNVGAALPGGVTLSPGGLLGGMPAAGTGGVYHVTFRVSNGIMPDGTQSFTLSVNEAPAITSADNATFTVGTAGTVTITATGYPTPTFTETGPLPNGVSLSSAGVLSGTPDADTDGSYPITVTASNSVGSDATQSFNLTVNPASCTPPPANMISWWPGDGNASDLIGGHDGTLISGANANTAGEVGNAFQFQGGSDVMQVPNSTVYDFGANEFTIDTWVRFNSVSGSDVLVAHDEGTGFVDRWIFWLHNGNLAVQLNGPAVGGAVDIGVPFSPSLGLWYHVAVTRSGSIYKFYVNGQQIGTEQISAATVPPANAPLSLGQAESLAAINGFLDEVQIFNRALTQPELAGIYYAGRFGTCAPPMRLTTAVSRKTHGTTGTFDVDLPLTGEPGIECRNGGGNHTLIFTFTNAVVSGTASVTSGNGSVTGAPTFAGKTMTVNLTGVSDAQQIAIKLSSVTDAVAQVLPEATVNMIVLLGDVTGNKAVNSTDISETKLESGAPVSGVVGEANFRNDVTVDGSINSTDVSTVKAHAGSGVP